MKITFNNDKTCAYIKYKGATKILKTKINLKLKKGEVISLDQAVSTFLASYRLSKEILPPDGVKIAWLRKLNYGLGTILAVLKVADKLEKGCYLFEELNKEDEADYVKLLRASVKFMKTNCRYYEMTVLPLI